MMWMKGGGISGVLLLVLIAWVFIGESPQERIVRTCRPVAWVGNVAASVTALTVPTFVDSLTTGFDRFEYGCQYSVWRLFFEEVYLQHQIEQQSKR